ncbi:ABC transporter permease [Desulfosporosinus youngiae]|uniref:ABC transporter permease n=1 Tax=Desulfosporosinus youngiae TaxID=339862 RepID=UPI0002E87E31
MQLKDSFAIASPSPELFSSVLEGTPFKNLSNSFLQIKLYLLFPILFGALTAYVFVQEYQDRTIIHLFTLPESRTKILLTKITP